MTPNESLAADLEAMRTDLTIATKHICALEQAIAHVLEERDHLRFLCGQQHDDLMRMQLEHENEERVLGDAVTQLQYDLKVSLDEQIRLLAQRRRLASHLQGLMVLARPGTASAKATARTGVTVEDLEPQEEETESPLPLIERFVLWACRQYLRFFRRQAA